MNDPWGSFQNFMNDFSHLKSNPAQYVMSRFGIPEKMANNPDAIMQALMNSGRISQGQYNAARKVAEQIQSNPMFQRYIR